ncbi:unnamed protein product, partial [Adineta ricciae]
DGTNPMIDPVEMNDGIFIYRIYEDFLYPNAANYMEKLVEEVFQKTKSGKNFLYKNLGEQPWNLQTSRHPQQRQHQLLDPRPHLHAIILDFTGISHVDITSLQHLADIRQQLDNYANSKVNWHFVGLANPWIKRALLAHGFGSSNDVNRTFATANTNSVVIPILDTNYPLFHVDVDEAYQTALADLAKRQNIDSSLLTVS